MANLHLINDLIEKKNLSIDQFAAKIGLKRGAIYKIMTENSTKIETLEKICKVLDVPISTFFTESEMSNKTSDDIYLVKERPPDLDGHKRLSNDERIDILLSQNDRLITVLEKHSQTIGTNSNTINTLTNTINNLSYNVQGDTSKNVSGGAA